MSDAKPLMPKATAVWLVDNTALTFDQIAAFCGLHPLEVKGIADGDVAQGIKGMDPISSGQLSRNEIDAGEKDAGYVLRLAESKVKLPKITRTKKGPRYTPVSRRQDRPNAILWLLRNHAELRDAQISRLVGTTKHTINQVRDRTHWNMTNLVAQDPVMLGLCSQVDLDAEVAKSAKRAAKTQPAAAEGASETSSTLLPADKTTNPGAAEPTDQITAAETTRESREEEEAQEAARMLAQLQQLSSGSGETDSTEEDDGGTESNESSEPEHQNSQGDTPGEKDTAIE